MNEIELHKYLITTVDLKNHVYKYGWRIRGGGNNFANWELVRASDIHYLIGAYIDNDYTMFHAPRAALSGSEYAIKALAFLKLTNPSYYTVILLNFRYLIISDPLKLEQVIIASDLAVNHD